MCLSNSQTHSRLHDIVRGQLFHDSPSSTTVINTTGATAATATAAATAAAPSGTSTLNSTTTTSDDNNNDDDDVSMPLNGGEKPETMTEHSSAADQCAGKQQ